MPASLADLRKARRDLTCTVLGDVEIRVRYRPAFLTPKVSAALERASEDEGATVGAVRTFVGYIEDWDLLGLDGETVVPLTEEGITENEVPIPVMLQITAQCVQDMQPGKARSRN